MKRTLKKPGRWQASPLPLINPPGKRVGAMLAIALELATFIVMFLLAACSSPAAISQHAANSTTTTPQASPTIPIQPTSGALPNRPITYVALGASDAVGIGSTIPGSQGYVPLIAAKLPRGSHLLDLGVSGISLHNALSAELPLALSTSPDLVTIWLVANDFIGGVAYADYMKDLQALLSQLRTHTHARLIMANLPDLTRLPAFANQTAAQSAQMLAGIQQWNSGIAGLATRYNVTLVDLFARGSEITAHPEYISGDGFHPSPAGYVQLANLFWLAIEGYYQH